jgi:hypothetical protein
MKKSVRALLPLICLIFMSCAARGTVNVELLKSEATFDRAGRADKVKVDCVLVLPPEMIRNLPPLGEDKGAWTWFFTRGFGSIFRNVVVVESLQEAERLPKAGEIIEPELLSWFLGELPQRQLDQVLWNCKMKLKFRFFDRKGKETYSLIVDKYGWGREVTEAVAEAMNGIIAKVRAEMKARYR